MPGREDPTLGTSPLQISETFNSAIIKTATGVQEYAQLL